MKKSNDQTKSLKDRLTILIHVVFSTKNQANLIDERIAPLLYTCIEGVLWEPYHSPALATGGGSDHVHILLGLSRTVTLDVLVREVKERSAVFMRSLGEKYKNLEWHEGFAAFTISRSDAKEIETYILRQREFHAKTSFQDEYRLILTEHGIEYDENEMWD